VDILSLNGEWRVVERPLTDGKEAMADVLAADASLCCSVPGDVSDALVRAGCMPEPLTGTNFREFRWVEERSWWFRRTIVVPAGWAAKSAIELSLDGLDIHADVWLNGQYLGQHLSAFYPFVKDVKSALAFGEENVLLVRLTTGMEHVPDDADETLLELVPTEAGRGYPDRGDKRRIYLRKPAYTWGWDWGPHLATCGITGQCELRALDVAENRDVALATELDGDDAIVTATVEIEYATLLDSARADLCVTLTDADGQSFSAETKAVFVASGVNLYDLSVRIPQARLWWPNGSGEQHLYSVTVRAVVDGQAVETDPIRYGVRTVELDTSPERFAFAVNGVPVFVKGGNWIPSDSLYGRVTPEKTRRLVEEAAEANFNCLRIWGGGRFEIDAFYDACDELGVMVWQDFMSACAPLPADRDWFVHEFRNEAEYQVRRLRSRACLALWCGNNEVGGCYTWFKQFENVRDPGWDLYHKLLPRLVRQLAPHMPYWPTSPYGGKGCVNDTREGDDHHWVVMRPESEFWSCPEYWDSPERPIFNSEYGYGGPCCIESTREYLGTDTPDLFNDVGREHTNTFYNIPRVNFSIQEHYRDTEAPALSDYILYGGLCQGLNLGYSLESLRANGHTMGGIFWMYNDTWGENGWTIIDYYLRRKVSYYNVKRCLAHRRLVLRRGGQAFGGKEDEVVLVAINDTGVVMSATVELGYVSCDGTESDLRTVEVSVAPRSKALIASVPVPDADALSRGTVVAIPADSESLDPVSWRHCRFRESGVPEADVVVERMEVKGDDLLVTVSSEAFAHAVHLDIAGYYRLSDHYFDLLPGETRTVTIMDGAALAMSAISARSVGAR